MREEPEKFAAEVVGKVLESWAIKAELESQVEESEGEQAVVLKIKTEEPGFIIGYHGQTLKDLEFITNLIVYRKLGEWNRVILDVGDYREKRKEFLETLAQRTAERVKSLGEPVALSPLPGNERRIVHLYLKNDPGVVTESVGEGDRRKVVVKPAGA